ncbi:MAG: hypothetical protein IPK82_06015 [Polyangiaceae bacterium]|nr:hypothetical protein [Polyangiaceae bacterium]
MTRNEQRLHDSAEVLLVWLRTAKGIHKEAAESLKAALGDLAEEWVSTDVIPKSAANLLVDLASGIDSCSELYHGNEAASIRDLAIEIGDLVRKCVS